jgi:hypothetical protein
MELAEKVDAVLAEDHVAEKTIKALRVAAAKAVARLRVEQRKLAKCTPEATREGDDGSADDGDGDGDVDGDGDGGSAASAVATTTTTTTTPSAPAPTVTVVVTSVVLPTHVQIGLEVGDVSLKLNKTHYLKLKRRYAAATLRGAFPEGGPAADVFHSRLFCLLQRYKSICGGGFQCALPPVVWATLREELELELEGFASPLNCTLDRCVLALPPSGAHTRPVLAVAPSAAVCVFHHEPMQVESSGV